MLLIGDVALAHDIGGLLAAKRLGGRLTIVLLDNEGGGIFDFLAVADTLSARKSEPGALGAGAGGEAGEQDVYTRHIATPTGLDFARAAALYGLEHETVPDVASFRAALERSLAAPGSTIIEARDRARGERRAASPRVERYRGGDQELRSGSNAANLISVSPSSAAGTESRTIPLPA